MRGAIVHGALLVVMLVYGYRTWTRDKEMDKPTTGNVVLWNRSETELASIVFETPKRTVKLERKSDAGGAYWWGSESKTEPKPSALPPMPPGAIPPGLPGGDPHGDPHGHGHPPMGGPPPSAPSKPGAKPQKPAKSGKPPASSSGPAPGPAKMADPSTVPQAGAPAPTPSPAAPAKAAPNAAKAAKSPAAPAAGAADPASSGPPPVVPAPGIAPADAAPAPPKVEEVTTTREFPLGESAEKLIKTFGSARALRSLGAITEANKKEYKLEDTTTSLSVVFTSGPTKTFIIGGSVYGGRDRYVLDPESNQGYVLSGDMVSPFESGEGALRMTDPRGFDPNNLHAVTVSAGGKDKAAVRVTQKDEKGTQTKTWGDAGTNKPDQTLANFIDSVDRLRPTKYEAQLKPAEMKLLVVLAYKDKGGAKLGTLSLYRHEKAGEALPTDGPVAPATVTDYYVLTEKSRVPGLVPKGTAEKVEQDIETIFTAPSAAPAPSTEPGKGAPAPTGAAPAAPAGGAPATGGQTPPPPAPTGH